MTEEARRGTAIVVGVDGSEQSKHALRWAAYLARLSGAAVHAITVEGSPMAGGSLTVPSAWNPKVDSEKILTSIIDDIFGAERPVAIRLLVRRGDAAEVLIDQSRHATMLVVGNRGHGGFLGLLLGSVSAKCAEHAECPVLVVHGAPPSVD